jgi:hypothetical protein
MANKPRMSLANESKPDQMASMLTCCVQARLLLPQKQTYYTKHFRACQEKSPEALLLQGIYKPDS